MKTSGTLCYLINPQYVTNFSSLPPYPSCRVPSSLYPFFTSQARLPLHGVAFLTWWDYDSLGHLHWDDFLSCLSKLSHSLVWTSLPTPTPSTPSLTFRGLLYALGPMAHALHILWCGYLLLLGSPNKFRTELFRKKGRGKNGRERQRPKKRNNLF